MKERVLQVIEEHGKVSASYVVDVLGLDQSQEEEVKQVMKNLTIDLSVIERHSKMFYFLNRNNAVLNISCTLDQITIHMSHDVIEDFKLVITDVNKIVSEDEIYFEPYFMHNGIKFFWWYKSADYKKLCGDLNVSQSAS